MADNTGLSPLRSQVPRWVGESNFSSHIWIYLPLYFLRFNSLCNLAGFGVRNDRRRFINQKTPEESPGFAALCLHPHNQVKCSYTANEVFFFLTHESLYNTISSCRFHKAKL